jgi:hypothetical protein
LREGHQLVENRRPPPYAPALLPIAPIGPLRSLNSAGG